MDKPIKSTFLYKGLEVILITNEHTLDEVLEAMDNVIRGSGFYPLGTLQYVED